MSPDTCHRNLNLICGDKNGIKTWLSLDHKPVHTGDIRCNEGRCNKIGIRGIL